MYDNVFAKICLPVKPDVAVDGATIHVVTPKDVKIKASFGGCADDFLGNLGFVEMEEAQPASAKDMA